MSLDLPKRLLREWNEWGELLGTQNCLFSFSNWGGFRRDLALGNVLNAKNCDMGIEIFQDKRLTLGAGTLLSENFSYARK